MGAFTRVAIYALGIGVVGVLAHTRGAPSEPATTVAAPEAVVMSGRVGRSVALVVLAKGEAIERVSLSAPTTCGRIGTVSFDARRDGFERAGPSFSASTHRTFSRPGWSLRVSGSARGTFAADGRLVHGRAAFTTTERFAGEAAETCRVRALRWRAERTYPE